MNVTITSQAACYWRIDLSSYKAIVLSDLSSVKSVELSLNRQSIKQSALREKYFNRIETTLKAKNVKSFCFFSAAFRGKIYIQDVRKRNRLRRGSRYWWRRGNRNFPRAKSFTPKRLGRCNLRFQEGKAAIYTHVWSYQSLRNRFTRKRKGGNSECGFGSFVSDYDEIRIV